MAEATAKAPEPTVTWNSSDAAGRRAVGLLLVESGKTWPGIAGQYACQWQPGPEAGLALAETGPSAPGSA